MHSEGGSVFEGFAIHDEFAKYKGPKSLSIESSAFSISSFIPCAFEDVEISPNGYMMLHNPYTQAEGDDEYLARQSDLLGKLKSSMIAAYAQRSGKSEDEIKSILKNETYLNAQQSVEMGLAKRIAGQPVIGRAFAKVKTMPHGVVAALFGAGSGGDNDSKKGHKMPESTPVAATLKEIKAAFPKAKAERVIAWALKEMPMASVAAAAAEEMMSENEELMAKCKAMEEELAKYKAMESESPDDEEEKPEAKAEEDEEEKPEAKAKSGVKPVAKARTSGPSASVRWNQAVDAAMAKTKDKMKAVALANRTHPGLREAYLAEANAR